MNQFDGKDNNGRPKQEYLDKLSGLSDEKLLEECNQYIWLSAYANNNPRSDFHWQCDACYAECVKRNKVKEIYERAYEQVKRTL